MPPRLHLLLCSSDIQKMTTNLFPSDCGWCTGSTTDGLVQILGLVSVCHAITIVVLEHGYVVSRTSEWAGRWSSSMSPMVHECSKRRRRGCMPRGTFVTSRVASALCALWKASISFSGNSQMTSLQHPTASCSHGRAANSAETCTRPSQVGRRITC